jgi:uncharacterized coiled-coil protein SlyX
MSADYLQKRLKLEEAKSSKLGEIVEELKLQLIASQKQINNLQSKLMDKGEGKFLASVYQILILGI